MNMLRDEAEEIWRQYCAETCIPQDATDDRISRVERDLGPDIGILMKITARSVNSRLHECHFPVMNPKYRICGKRGIKAHSISRSAFLNQMSSGYHLMHMTDQKLPMKEARGGRPIKSTWQKIGTGEASVFTGLCQEHDSEVFSIIDNQELPIESKKYQFLSTFRAVIKYHWEYYDALNLIKQMRLADRKTDWIPSDSTIDISKRRCDTMLSKWFQAWHTRDTGGLNKVIHISHRYEHDIPSVAYSSVIGMGSATHPRLWTPPDGGEILFVLNVLPYKGFTTATISFYEDDYANLKADMPPLFSTDPADRKTKDVISSIMVSNSGNLYLSKEYFSQISEEQKEWMIAVRERFKAIENYPALGDAPYNLLDS